MTHQEPAPTAQQQASRWWVRLDSGEMSAGEQAAFEQWLKDDPAHRAAFADLCALWGELDGLQGRFKGTSKSPSALKTKLSTLRQLKASASRPARRRFARAMTGLAASLVLLVMATPAWRADYRSGVGETQTLRLADGSTVYLGSDTDLDVDLGADSRRLKLLRGEAWIEVAHDTARPFVVEAGNGTATALGTVYDVRHVDGEVRVTVIESRVAVATPGQPTLNLNAGQQTVYGKGYGTQPPHPVDIDTVSAWRRGRMVFENQPLGAVIAELNRHHHGHIAITDAAIRERPVSGVFRTDKPLEAIATLENSLGLKSTHLSSYLVLLHR